MSTRLTLNVVIDAAAALVDRDGARNLTMKRIADSLGVTPMALYRHVRTKQDLLAHLADRYFAEVDYAGAARLSWQERIHFVFASAREVFTRHPDLAEILATQPIDGPSALRGVEIILEALHEVGLPDSAAVEAVDALRSFSAGFVLREAAYGQAGASATFGGVRAMAGLRADLPHVRRLAGELIAPNPDGHFRAGLDIYIKGLERMLEEAGTRA